jgi:hypothetical protein
LQRLDPGGTNANGVTTGAGGPVTVGTLDAVLAALIAELIANKYP